MTDPSSAPVPRPHHDAGLRASHTDREAVAERLRQAAGEGRLEIEELEERLEKALNAKTYGELEPLTADLPPSGAGLVSPTAQQEEPLTLRAGAGDITQEGYWRVPARIQVVARMGDVKIDFTQAECHQREVVVDVNAGIGNVTLIVPHGWSVRTHALRVTVGSVRNRATDPPSPGSPTLNVTGRAAMGDVRVRYLNRWETWRRNG